jgi:hypothetical protein
MIIDWVSEWPQIQAWSAKRGVDPLFIAAIRHAENGGPGKELGCLGVGADTYDAQLRVATRTIAGYVANYPLSPFVLVDALGFKRLGYAPAFILWTQHRWAPAGVANDPTNLNANWLTDVTEAYAAFVAAGMPA